VCLFGDFPTNKTRVNGFPTMSFNKQKISNACMHVFTYRQRNMMTRKETHLYTYMCTYMYIRIHTYMNVYVYKYICVHTYTHTHTRTNTLMYNFVCLQITVDTSVGSNAYALASHSPINREIYMQDICIYIQVIFISLSPAFLFFVGDEDLTKSLASEGGARLITDPRNRPSLSVRIYIL